MLGDNDAIATIAVKDLANARRFYEGALGLKPAAGENQATTMTYRSGAAKLLLYESKYAGTNRATAATWVVRGDFDGLVAGLKSNGVSFEHYDLPGLTLKGDVHVAGNFKGVWFKDPDGNILHVLSTGA